MGYNNLEDLLLSDLLCLYLTTNEPKYYEQLKFRFLFCGFTIVELQEFLRFEKEIISCREEKYNKSITDKYWIIGKQDQKVIFDDPDIYMYDPDSDNSKTLLISETLSIIDEATFISYSRKITDFKSKYEILYLSQESEENWLYFEFFNRMEYICRCANKIMDGPKVSLYSEKIGILYENEMQICMKRWKDIDVSSKRFVPYTEQYFY